MHIQPILDFLTQLENNNTREWMEANRATYEQVRGHFIETVALLIEKISLFDESVADLTPKDCIYRQNRDIRFSKDKTLYKTHFGAYIAQGGKQSQRAGYYFHLQPGNRSLFGGGAYLPEKDELKNIRQEIDYNTDQFLGILEAPGFKKYFAQLQGEKLKTMPRDYPRDHPQAELLKLKSFFATQALTDQQVVQPDLNEHLLDGFRALKPFNDFMNTAMQAD